MPRVLASGAQLHVSEVAAIVETRRAAAGTAGAAAARPEDAVISEIIAAMVPDGACLQMGVGALPNLVCAR